MAGDDGTWDDGRPTPEQVRRRQDADLRALAIVVGTWLAVLALFVVGVVVVLVLG